MPILSFDIRANYQEATRLREEISQLERQLRSFGPGTSVSSIRMVEGQLQSARIRFQELTREAANAGSALEFNIRNGANAAIAAVSELQSKISNPITGFSQLLGVAALGGFIERARQVRGQFQMMETNINTILGSAEKGKDLMRELTQYAAESPLDFKGTVGAAQQMLGFGIEVKKVLPFLKAIGDVSMGNAQNFRSLTLAFSQMSAAGKLMGQDLMQMVNAGFQPLEQMAKDTGKSIGQLKDEMSQGKISAEMVQQSFINATKEGGKYFNMSANATATIGGQMSMLEDNIDLMFNEIGKNSESVIMKAIEGAVFLTDHYEEVAGVLGTIIASYGIYKASVMASEFAAQVAAEDKSRAVVEGYEKEIQKLQELRREKELAKFDDDLQGSVKDGVIDADTAKEVQEYRNELREAADAAVELAEANLEEKESALQAAKESLVSAQEKLDSMEELADMAEQAGDDNDKLIAQDEVAAATKARDAAAAKVLSAETARNSAQTQLNTAQVQQNTVARASNTGAQTTNTSAQNANNTATGRGTALTALNTAGTKVATIAKHAWTAATKQATRAWNGLKIAMATNPFGLILTAVSAAVGLFMSLRDKTEEVNAEVERFGENTVKARNNIDTLYAVLNSVDKESNVYSKSMDELIKIAKEYGITIDDEKDKLEQLNAKRAQLIELLNREGEVRQYANQIAGFEKDKSDKLEKFSEKIKELIEDESKGNAKEQASKFAQMITSTVALKYEELATMGEELARLQNEYASEYHKGNNTPESLEYLSEHRKRIAELQTNMAKIANEDAKRYAEILGVGDEYILDIKDVSALVGEVSKNLQTTQEYTEKTKTEMQKVKEAQNAAKPVRPEIDYSAWDPKKLTEELTKIDKQTKTLNETKIEPPSDKINISELVEESRKAQSELKDIDNTEVKPATDNSDIEKTKDKSVDTKDKLDEIDKSAATPFIDTKYLDIAISKLDNIKLKMKDVGGNVLNLSDSERVQMDYLLKKYGNGGKILPGTMMHKDDAAIFNRISANAKSRSYISEGEGEAQKTYHLTPEQSAVYQRLMDSYGNDLEKARGSMNKQDLKVYDSLIFEAKTAKYNKDLQNGVDDANAIKNAIDKKIKDAKTTEDFSNLRSNIKSQQGKVDQNSSLYKYYERKLKEIDNRDKSKNKDDSKQREYDRKKAEDQEKLRLEQKKKEEEFRKRQLEIDKASDSTDKDIATARLEADKKRNSLDEEVRKEFERLRDFDRQQWLKGDKQRKAYNWKQTSTDDEYMERAKENVGFNTQAATIAEAEKKKVDTATKEAEQKMRDYLREYGTYAEKIKAIDTDFTEKIRTARTEGERKTLEKEWRNAVDELKHTSDDFLRSIMDVSSVLDNLAQREAEEITKARSDGKDGFTIAEIRRKYREERQNAVVDKLSTTELEDGRTIQEMMGMLAAMQTDALDRLMEDITEYANIHATDLGADGQSKVRDMLSEIDDAIVQRTDGWKKFIGGIPAAISDMSRANERLARAKESYKDASAKRDTANIERDARKQELHSLIKQMTGKDDAEVAKSIEEGTVTNDVAGLEPDQISEINAAQEAYAGAADAAAQAGEAASGAAAEMGAASSASGAAGAAMTDAIIHGVNDNLQSVPELLDQLGLSDTGFGKGMKDFAESSQYATQAFDALKSGNFVGV